MENTQVLTVVIAIVVPTAAVIYSNSRVGDVSKRIDDANSRVGDLRTDMNRRFDELEQSLKQHIDTAFEHMKLLLQLHEAQHHDKR